MCSTFGGVQSYFPFTRVRLPGNSRDIDLLSASGKILAFVLSRLNQSIVDNILNLNVVSANIKALPV